MDGPTSRGEGGLVCQFTLTHKSQSTKQPKIGCRDPQTLKKKKQNHSCRN